LSGGLNGLAEAEMSRCSPDYSTRLHPTRAAAARRIPPLLAAVTAFVFLLVATVSVQAALAVGETGASPDTIEIPRWFAASFLDFREDIADAARDGKRLLVYFGQEGCPYCKQLIVANFSQRAIVEKTREHFVAIALDLWGDRETTWIDGRSMTEKELARFLNVQFTPTLLFFDENGDVVARLNGYYPPQRFEAVLDYVAKRLEGKQTLAEYLASTSRAPANPRLRSEPFFIRADDLRPKSGDRPLAVIFETVDCSPCDELHREAFRRSEVRALLDRFDVAQLQLGTASPLTTPDGRRTTVQAWATELGIAYTPAVLFFDATGAEVFRIDAYLRPFHFASSLDYVASGAYRNEPSFQRYLQTRAARMRELGQGVDLWR
jgi:thioredoxin-related protein